ncbi:MAG: SH3 domain-containing protein [Chloroflexota bacterium]
MKRLAPLAAALLTLAACTLRAGPTPTPTLSSQDALRTAETMAEATRLAASPTASPTPVPASPTPVLTTDTSTPTATPSSAIVTANYNANVRSGPDVAFDWVDFLLQGQSAQVVGRYENTESGTWWYIRRIGQGKDGWIWGGAVTLSGDASGIPLLPPPPTSTSAPPPAPSPTLTPSPTP